MWIIQVLFEYSNVLYHIVGYMTWVHYWKKGYSSSLIIINTLGSIYFEDWVAVYFLVKS